MAVAAGVQVVIDCAEPHKLAEFWAAALGYIVQPPPQGYDTWEAFARDIGFPEDQLESRSAVIDPEGRRPRIYLQRVPEPKTGKNRIHLDLHASMAAGLHGDEARAFVASEVQRLTGLGARVVESKDEYGQHWVVLRDPEGNEFCVS